MSGVRGLEKRFLKWRLLTELSTQKPNTVAMEKTELQRHTNIVLSASFDFRLKTSPLFLFMTSQDNDEAWYLHAKKASFKLSP